MEGYSSLGPYQKHPLARVYLKFSPETFNSELQGFLKFLRKASTVEELNNMTFKAGKKIASLDSFDECHVKVLPGKENNTAEVQFHLAQKRFFTPQINLETDPLEVSFNSYFRNLFGRVNLLKLKLGLELQDKNRTFLIDYLSKVGLANRFQYGFQVKKEYNYLDINTKEHLYGLGAYAKTYDNSHIIQVGYYLRNNEIFVDNASAELINEGLLPSTKYSLAYKYSDPAFKLLNRTLGVKFLSELAFSDKFEFLKLENAISDSWSITKYLKILATLGAGYIIPLQSSHLSINDRLRVTDFKGFRFLGRRFKPNDEILSDKLAVAGDHLGTRAKLSGEVQLVHEAFPVLARLRISPFLFASAVYLQETSDWLQNARAAAGFGARLRLPFGELEFVYTSKVWSRPGDNPAEFQIFFKEN